MFRAEIRIDKGGFLGRFQFLNVYVASLYKSSLSESLIGKHSLCPSASVSDPPPLLSLKLALAWSKPTPTLNGLFVSPYLVLPRKF